MALRIDTYSNLSGGFSVFKALGHPLAAHKARDLVRDLTAAGPVAIYDPAGLFSTFAEFYALDAVRLAGVYDQDVARIGRPALGAVSRPVTDLPESGAATVLVAAFDAGRIIAQIDHLLPKAAAVVTLDALRLPDALLTVPADYLSKLNWATNFAFFREDDGHHTRLVTANYWGSYGAREGRLWLCLFDADGHELAHWVDPLPPAGGTVVIDSRDVRRRFGLGAFCGSLFIHVVGAAGHDVVKYALDTYGDDDDTLSCTHDANAWPADRYAGLPAPGDGETVLLWVQNSHPCPIPAGAIGVNRMGDDRVVPVGRTIPPFGTAALDVAELLPEARWPQQIEVRAGRHFVRPRYEVVAAGGRRRIAHANVERTDLKPDPRLPELTGLLGKGFLLPAPVLPPDRYRSIVLPTPMATGQGTLPVMALVFDRDGREVARHRFGPLNRRDSVALAVDELVAEGPMAAEGGHVELVYDFAAGREADGWLHALFRYEDRAGGHAAETSFGAHLFNTVLVHKDEPQSYTGRPPGLSTRLFLRLGPAPWDSFCCLIYPASTPWRPLSDTTLVLTRRDGVEVARRRLAIPCGGSRWIRYAETFGEAERREAGDHAFVLVRDTTCRLFGYHGCARGGPGGAFSLDHMFGF